MASPKRIFDLWATDVHAHVGNCRGWNALTDRLCSATALVIAKRARLAHIRWTMVSSFRALLPRGKGDVMGGNREAARAVSSAQGLLFWAVLDPRNADNRAQVAELLSHPKCVGIKIHPEEHVYPIKKQGKAIFEFAAERRAIVLTHSGEKNSMPEDFVKWANAFPEVRLILGHLGCGWDADPGHQVRAIQRSKHGNMFVDTSSASSIIPGLIERAVKEIGSERILFGTDSSCYFAPMQRARIDFAEISHREKCQILFQNAERLFNFKEGPRR